MRMLVLFTGIALEVCRNTPLLLAGERSYRYYDVTFPYCHSDPSSAPEHLNDSGVVTGYYVVEDCIHGHAYTWFNGVVTDLDDTYDAGLFGGAEWISRTGVVVGYGDPDRVLALIDGVAIPQPVPPGCDWHQGPESANDAGTMAVGLCGPEDMPGVHFLPAFTGLRKKCRLN